MFYLFLTLDILFAIILVIGFVWMLIVSGKTSKSTSSSSEIDQNGKGTIFVGQSIQVERKANYSYTEIKQLIRSREFLKATPPILGMVGLNGLIFFLGLTFLIGMSDPIFGYPLLAMGFYSMYLMVAGFRGAD